MVCIPCCGNRARPRLRCHAKLPGQFPGHTAQRFRGSKGPVRTRPLSSWPVRGVDPRPAQRRPVTVSVRFTYSVHGLGMTNQATEPASRQGTEAQSPQLP